MKRVVTPEILDGLTADDPDAVRSRRDLRRINTLMGNFRWMRGSIRRRPSRERQRLVELGSGDGGFITRVRDEFRAAIAVDLAPRPEALPVEIEWRRGDIFEELTGLGKDGGGALVANLFLHHFEDGRLEKLGELARSFDVLCFSEPWRSRVALAEACLIWPSMNRVTRHDMMVSIRAGFVRGELPVLLGLGEEWEWREEVSLLGACRLVAWKNR